MIKFLIIRLSSIGDIVLTSPIVRILATQLPEAEVHFFVKKEFAEVVKHNPHIAKIHLYDGDIAQNIKVFKQENFDYVIDLHKNLRSFRVRNGLSSLWFSFNKLNFEKWLMVNFKINKLPDKHIVDRYFEAVSKFDVELDDKGLDYFIDAKDEVNIAEYFGDRFADGFVAFVVGARHFTKQIPLFKAVEIINGIGVPVILLGGKNDEAFANEIVKNTNSSLVKSGVGQFRINQSASVIKNARVVVTPDTGLMHIAAAFKRKIISLWGNTIPEFGMYPYKPHPDSRIFEVNGLRCRPCSKIGYDKCPKNHFRCMADINTNDVINAVKNMWK